METIKTFIYALLITWAMLFALGKNGALIINQTAVYRSIAGVN